MPLPIYHVDAFTSTPFRGNPAGVCLLTRAMDESWMQFVAAEMNLPETAFVLPEGPNTFNIRWMTPMNEVDLCGHATLASAHLLYELAAADTSEPITFSSRSGPLVAQLPEDMIELDFPSVPPVMVSEPPKALLAGISDRASYIGKNQFDYLVELESESAVRALKPNLAQLSTLGVRGVVVTARAESGKDYDFISRGFFPGVGIDEDPVTGSAHCMLGPYWQSTLGKSEMTGYQASKRGGYVKLRIEGDRVKLLGHAVTVIAGVLTNAAS